MKKKIMIIGVVLGTFILCALIVMFAARHDKARSALCIQCHVTKSAAEQWKKAKMTIDSDGKSEKLAFFYCQSPVKSFSRDSNDPLTDERPIKEGKNAD